MSFNQFETLEDELDDNLLGILDDSNNLNIIKSMMNTINNILYKNHLTLNKDLTNVLSRLIANFNSYPVSKQYLRDLETIKSYVRYYESDPDNFWNYYANVKKEV